MKTKCLLCGASIRLTEVHGKDSFGKKDIWYKSNHRCPKLASSRGLMNQIEKGLSI